MYPGREEKLGMVDDGEEPWERKMVMWLKKEKLIKEVKNIWWW